MAAPRTHRRAARGRSRAQRPRRRGRDLRRAARNRTAVCGIARAAGVERGLLGPREVDRIWDRHLLNSAAVAELLEPGERVVDIGSGAGLPGIPLAIARPDLRWCCSSRCCGAANFSTRSSTNSGWPSRWSVAVPRNRQSVTGAAERDAVGVASGCIVGQVDEVELCRCCGPAGGCWPSRGSGLPMKSHEHRRVMTASGAADVRVVTCGVNYLRPPATVVVARRGKRPHTVGADGDGREPMSSSGDWPAASQAAGRRHRAATPAAVPAIRMSDHRTPPPTRRRMFHVKHRTISTPRSAPPPSAQCGCCTPPTTPLRRPRPSPALHDREPEGRRRQDHHGGQPRRGAGACRDSRLSSSTSIHRATRAPRSASPIGIRARRRRTRCCSARSRCRTRCGAARTASACSACPATIDLAGAEIELVSMVARENRLRTALAELDELDFDYVFIDCPPSLGLLTINALVAAPEVLIPIQCEYYALEGVSPADAQHRDGQGAPEPASSRSPP